MRVARLVAVSASGSLLPQRIWCAMVNDALYLAVVPHSAVAAALRADGHACLLFDDWEIDAVTGTVVPIQPDQIDDPELDRLARGAFAGRLLYRLAAGPVAPPETLDDPVERRLVVQHIFSDLPRSVAGVMARRLRYQTYQPGSVVIKQGSEGDQFFIVVDGEVDVVSEKPDGSEEVLGTLGPGESFGEAALLLNSPRTATVRARTPLRVLALDRTTFEQVVLLTGQEDSL
ncbi:MAG: cyclic nucleotide-binding domain-containing protein [Chloroflexota bacterium]